MNREIKILLVEDDELSSLIIQKILKSLGYKISAAVQTGEAAFGCSLHNLSGPNINGYIIKGRTGWLIEHNRAFIIIWYYNLKSHNVYTFEMLNMTGRNSHSPIVVLQNK